MRHSFNCVEMEDGHGGGDPWMLGSMQGRMTRRAFARHVATVGLATMGTGNGLRGQGPAVSVGGRPTVLNGVQSGDVTADSAVVWARSDRVARMVVEWDTTDRFRNVRRVTGPVTGPEADHTAKVVLAGLPSGERIVYRVRFEDRQGAVGDAEPGAFTTAARGPGEVRFAWSGDTCGQGWGIDEARGGMRTYESIRRAEPQFFVHSGDTIYADNSMNAEVVLPDGTTWRNRVTPEKSKVAETLAEFRGNYRYTLLDANVRRLMAEVPTFVQWDDHEVLNNWWPGQKLAKGGHYHELDVDVLTARSRQAFFEYHPIAESPGRRIHRRISRGPLCELFFIDLRSHRSPNNPNRQVQPGRDTDLMGAGQLSWLVEALGSSRATWKFVCSDMPLGLVVQDVHGSEAYANGDDGPPLGRELELAALLKGLKARGVRNVVWLTADVHYCASHHYDPSRARFTEFDPFWEFVSGPLHAGTFGPTPLDRTFGPEARFSSRQPGMASGGPWSKEQFFGTVRIDPKTRACTVTHWNRDGERLWATELPAA